MASVEWKGGLPTITTERLVLRIGEVGDVDSEIEFYEQNKEHLGRWFPDSGGMHMNRSAMRQYVPELRKKAFHGLGFRFRIDLRTDRRRFAGLLNLSRVERGPEQKAVLGYGIAKELEGKGYMSEAVRAAVRFAFDDLDLHRLEACYAPANERSGNLLKACGFQEEGVIRGMLMINGVWTDHVMASILNPDWRGGHWR